MKPQRLPDGLLDGERAGTQVLKLADVVRLRFVVGQKRVHARNLLFFDPQHPRANRCAKPLVQAGAEVVALQIGDSVVEVGKTVRPIHDHLDAPPVGFAGNAGHGQNLARPVEQVRQVNDLRFRRKPFDVAVGEIFFIFRRQFHVGVRQFDALAEFALPPGVEHVRVVVFGQNHLVAALEREAENDGVEGFGGVAVDGNFIGANARQRGQLLAEGFAALVHDAPHVVTGGFVGVVVVAFQGVLHGFGRGADAAVVEVEQRRRSRKRLLNRYPVIFVAGGLFRREVGAGHRERLQPGVGERLQLGRQREGGGVAQKRSSGSHGAGRKEVEWEGSKKPFLGKVAESGQF